MSLTFFTGNTTYQARSVSPTTQRRRDGHALFGFIHDILSHATVMYAQIDNTELSQHQAALGGARILHSNVSDSSLSLRRK